MTRTRRVVLKDLLTPDQKESLEAIYLSREVASDQLRRDSDALGGIVDTFRAATGREDIDAGLLLKYIFNRRKGKDWPRLGVRAKRFEPVEKLLSSSELSALEEVYQGLDETSDNLMFSTAMMRRVAQLFREATGQSRPGSVLVAVIVAKRKRRQWIRIREGDRAFADIADVARKYGSA
jgi:hypothetical protein